MTRAQDRAQFVELAASLRKYRLRKGVTQVGAAKEMGVGASMLRDWEFGVTIPSAVNFITWTRVLGFFVEVVDGEAGSGA